MAKTLGGGVAIGAMMAKPEIAASLVPGKHASTFGGNCLACAAGIATIETIEEGNLLANAVDGPVPQESLRHSGSLHHRPRARDRADDRHQLTRPPPKSSPLHLGLRINCTTTPCHSDSCPDDCHERQTDEAVGILRQRPTES
jgi:hypothetical protein